MNHLSTLVFEEKPIRTVIQDNEPFFCNKDVCEILGIGNSSDALSRFQSKGVVYSDTPTNGGVQRLAYISDRNLFRLVMRSSKEEAERFQDWVYEVVKTIRETGKYEISTKSDLQVLAEANIVAMRVISELTAENASLKPKAEFFDAVANSSTALPIGKVAKILNMGVGQNQLFDFLRRNKILMANNIPYQKYVNAGYFKVIEQKYLVDNEVNIGLKTLVYQKGVDYIRYKLLEFGYTSLKPKTTQFQRTVN